MQDKIMNQVNSILRNLSDVRLQFVSVTKVELNNDYSQAKLYWDTFDSSKRGDAKKALESVVGKVRTLLAAALKLRHVPSLLFCYDSQFEEESKIVDILKEEAKEGKLPSQ